MYHPDTNREMAKIICERKSLKTNNVEISTMLTLSDLAEKYPDMVYQQLGYKEGIPQGTWLKWDGDRNRKVNTNQPTNQPHEVAKG